MDTDNGSRRLIKECSIIPIVSYGEEIFDQLEVGTRLVLVGVNSKDLHLKDWIAVFLYEDCVAEWFDCGSEYIIGYIDSSEIRALINNDLMKDLECEISWKYSTATLKCLQANIYSDNPDILPCTEDDVERFDEETSDEFDEYDDSVECPICGSRGFSVKKQGVNVPMAMLGGAIFGAKGLLGGLIGIGDVTACCKECGYEWDL